MVNFMVPTMAIPYSQVAMAITYFTGKKMEEWAYDQLILLNQKVQEQGRAVNDEGLWDEFLEDFRHAWGDTAKEQRADIELRKLSMKDLTINEYVAKFEVLI